MSAHDRNVPLPKSPEEQARINAIVREVLEDLQRRRIPPAPSPPWRPCPVATEALLFMRDTTNSTAQHARAVSALKAMGVSHE